MKRIFFLSLLFFIGRVIVYAGNNPFILSTANSCAYSINQMFSDVDSIVSFFDEETIYALSISGSIQLLSERSHVRVLLEDTSGKQYQIMESCRMFSENDTINFLSYCEETHELHGIVPSKIKIFVTDALLRVDSIYTYVQNGGRNLYQSPSTGTDVSIKRKQVEKIVDRINAYNEREHKLWRAAVTPLSLMTYEDKKRILRFEDGGDTQGIEYYASGIFEMGYPDEGEIERNSNNSEDSLFVPEFDWRCRHGKNWVTPVRDQGNSGYCWAFSTVAATEAAVNLYYNQILNLDLSEQDVGYYTYNDHHGYYGGNPQSALQYIRDNGVVDESTIPFVDNPNLTLSEPRTNSFNEKIKIGGYQSISEANNILGYPNTKRALIKNGVLSSGVVSCINHTMALVGYGTISPLDTLTWYDSNSGAHGSVVGEYDNRIGKTYWKFKNSDGVNPGYGINGYLYVYFVDPQCMAYTYEIHMPITSENLTDEDIICEDADGDGFYFWGLGPKPNFCPSWVPDEPDGDDSDYTKGPMDEYGWLRDLNPNSNDTLYIDTDTIWNTYRYQHRHVCIRNNAKLTVCDTVKCYRDVSFTIRPNSTLLVNGGTMEDADVKAQTGSNVKIQSNGRIIPCTNKNFSIPLGAKMRIDYGRIK